MFAVYSFVLHDGATVSATPRRTHLMKVTMLHHHMVRVFLYLLQVLVRGEKAKHTFLIGPLLIVKMM